MGLSFWHILLLVGIALLFFGPARLPGLGRSMGEAIRGFKKGLSGEEIDVTETSRNEQLKDGQGQNQTQTQSQKQTDKV